MMKCAVGLGIAAIGIALSQFVIVGLLGLPLALAGMVVAGWEYYRRGSVGVRVAVLVAEGAILWGLFDFVAFLDGALPAAPFPRAGVPTLVGSTALFLVAAVAMAWARARLVDGKFVGQLARHALLLAGTWAVAGAGLACLARLGLPRTA